MSLKNYKTTVLQLSVTNSLLRPNTFPRNFYSTIKTLHDSFHRVSPGIVSIKQMHCFNDAQIYAAQGLRNSEVDQCRCTADLPTKNKLFLASLIGRHGEKGICQINSCVPGTREQVNLLRQHSTSGTVTATLFPALLASKLVRTRLWSSLVSVVITTTARALEGLSG